MALQSKGGKRPGAGRPAGEATRVVRLPLNLATLAKRMADRTLRAGDINAFLNIEGLSRATVPLVSSSVACGFPSPADDYMDRPLDFNELLIENPAATFAVRIAGESMKDAGLFPGDIAIIDRARQAVSGCIILALLNGEFTIKRYRRKGNRVILEPESKAFAPIEVTEEASFEVWGVVTKSIRML